MLADPFGNHMEEGRMNVFKLLLVVLASVWVWTPVQTAAAAEAPSFDHSHALWTQVLSKAVVGDRVDYAALEKDHALLDRYLLQLHAVTPKQVASWTREQRFAFWINTYNAHCMALVVKNYPIESIKDLGGLFTPVWKKAFIEMPAFNPSGDRGPLSLDDIEHKILRPTFKDARVHAAVNCASESCPALRPEAFVAERIEKQLDEQVRTWLADSTRNRFDSSKARAEVSAIFDWFEEDFVRDGGSVVGWIAKYAPESASEVLKSPKLSLKHRDYSWKLNDVKR